MPEALPELVPLAVEFLCFALVWTIRVLLGATLGILAAFFTGVHIPFVGTAIGDAIHQLEQSVDNALGKVEHGIGSMIGATWHRFAQLNNWLWREFTQHSLIGWLLSQEIALLSHGYHYLHGRVSDLTGSHDHSAARIKSLERELHGIEHQVKTLERDYAHGIGDDVLPRLKALDREIAHVTTKEIPAIRSAESDAADAISNLYEWAKGKAALLGVGTFALAVTSVLSAVGLDWIACRGRDNVNGKSGCNLWGDIEAVLGLATLTLTAGDLEEIARGMQALERPVTTAMADLTGVAGKLGL